MPFLTPLMRKTLWRAAVCGRNVAINNKVTIVRQTIKLNPLSLHFLSRLTLPMKRKSSKENGVVGISCKKKKALSEFILFSPSKRKPAKKNKKKGNKVLKHFNHTAFSIKWKVLLFHIFHWIAIDVLVFSQKFCIVLAAFVSFVDWVIPAKLPDFPQTWQTRNSPGNQFDFNFLLSISTFCTVWD